MRTLKYTVNGKELRFRGTLYVDEHGKPMCNAPSPDGDQCTRPMGHLGDHTAEDIGATWDNPREVEG